MHIQIRKIILVILGLVFFPVSLAVNVPAAWGQDVVARYAPSLLRGIKIYPNDPFRFDFILDQGDRHPEERSDEGSQRSLARANEVSRNNAGDPSRLSAAQDDANRLIKYFLASLTIPEKDLWVNLSPYEKDRIAPEAFGRTEMGRDLLEQDYMLKEITTRMMSPDGELGRAFWDEVYKQAQERFGTTDIPVDTFNKVWIVPAKAVVFEKTLGHPEGARTNNGSDVGVALGRLDIARRSNESVAYVVEAKLKVMLDSDYLAMSNNATPTRGHGGEATVSPSTLPSGIAFNTKATEGVPLSPSTHEMTIEIIRQIILPALEKEVNEGKSFSKLRQVYHALILASWYKKKMTDSLLGRVYVDQQKVTGVDIHDRKMKERIWDKYVDLFRKGAFGLIKEEEDPLTGETIPRKYFSGGVNLDNAFVSTAEADLPGGVGESFLVQVRVDPAQGGPDKADAPGFQKLFEDTLVSERITEAHMKIESLYKSLYVTETDTVEGLSVANDPGAFFDRSLPGQLFSYSLLDMALGTKRFMRTYLPQGSQATAGEVIAEIDESLLKYEMTLQEQFPAVMTAAGLQHVAKKAMEISGIGKGFFFSKRLLEQILNANPPQKLLSEYGVGDLRELLGHLGVRTVFTLARFVEGPSWQENTYQLYSRFAREEKVHDLFEEREISIVVLDDVPDTLRVYFEKKLPFSDDKLAGVLIGYAGVLAADANRVPVLRALTRALHYLHEIDFYSRIFEQRVADAIMENRAPAQGVVMALRDDTRMNHIFETHPTSEALFYQEGLLDIQESVSMAYPQALKALPFTLVIEERGKMVLSSVIDRITVLSTGRSSELHARRYLRLDLLEKYFRSIPLVRHTLARSYLNPSMLSFLISKRLSPTSLHPVDFDVMFADYKDKVLELTGVDRAEALGGIDLDPARMDINVKSGGLAGMGFHFDPIQWARVEAAPGFVPVILNVRSLESVPKFIGLEQ